ncbi:ABC transporter ATP-binding protein [Halarcobacter sp.]|uniref:ABC transporter ATP-binding protein n=1 Tax=Halarcobacter sp. TaxID=2321133 RepID=UPI0029F53B54|nr:ABC transporter ATP-binding protein [Halarcobacter sp.]
MGVKIEDITMEFEKLHALKNVNLNIEKGEFFSILGPSGCGKTTLLKIISGFLEPTKGKVFIADQNMKNVSANKRPTSLVFQNLALFLNISVKENIAFGLRVKKVDNKQIDKKVNELLKMVSLEEYENSSIEDLSGGQKQRVAIARALAVEPKVLLLDEPLSALDLKLRQHMRKELRALQKLTGITFIYITHDQGEALSMSDKVAVMSKGRVEQVSTPQELYNNPKTTFVANFVGENNEFNGKIIRNLDENVIVKTIYGNFNVIKKAKLKVGDSVKLFIRPERFSLKQKINSISLNINTSSFEGSLLNIYLKRYEEDLIKNDIVLHKKNNNELQLKVSKEKMTIYFDENDVVLLKAF